MRSAIRLSLTENAQNIPRCAKTRIIERLVVFTTHSPKPASLVSGSPWGAGTDDIRLRRVKERILPLHMIIKQKHDIARCS